MPANKTQVFFVDISIFILQFICLVIAYDMGHQQLDGSDNLAPTSSSSQDDYAINDDSEGSHLI